MSSQDIIERRAAAFRMDKIVLFGDSITQHLYDPEKAFNFAAFNDRYRRKKTIVNRGFGGYNTEMARLMVEPMLEYECAGGAKIDLVVVYLGTNDCAEVSNKLQHVDLSRYSDNLRFICQKTRERGANIIIAGPGLFNYTVPETVLKDPTNQRGHDFLRYSQTCRDVAKEFAVPFIDLFHAHLAYLGWSEEEYFGNTRPDAAQQLSELFTDEVHYTGVTNKIYYDELVKTIRDHYPAIDSDNMTEILPFILDIDPDNLEKSLFGDLY
jgi:lysophospholipase L1-like esterase